MNPNQTEETTEVVLVDTNVLSYVSKPSDSRCAPYQKHLEGKTVALSFITVGEIYSGIKKNNIGEKRIAEIEERISVAILIPFDIEICKAYANLLGLKKNGSTRAMEHNDRWIAACAIRHNLRLVTHNAKHFEDIPGLELITESNTLSLWNEEDDKSIVL